MKKISTLMLLVAFALVISGCRKEGMDDGTTSTKTINVDMNANDTYSIEVLHAGDSDDAMQITKQAAHYTNSGISPASNGNVLFEYKPALDYIGTDEVQISNVESSHGSSHGNCGGGKHHENTMITIFKINVKATAAS